jgi:general stress protein 26
VKSEYKTVQQILLIAKETIAKVANCWAVTADLTGGANARLVQPYSSQLDDGDWIVCFLTNASSRKVAEMRRTGKILLCYQYDPEQASVTLLGETNIIGDRAYLRDQWRKTWDVYFPLGPEDTDAIIVQVAVERIEVLNMLRRIGKLTQAMQAATLRRSPSGAWQIVDE